MGLREWLGFGAKATGGFPVVSATRQVPWFSDSTTGLLGGFYDLNEILGLSPGHLWRTQPHLRTVVTFLARNIAQLGLHVFTRTADDSRERNRTDVAAVTLSRPNDYMTTYELVTALASDLALYDNAYWQVVANNDNARPFSIIPIQAAWVTTSKGGNAWQPEYWVVQTPHGRSVDIPAKDVIHFHGWDPMRSNGGTSPVETLKQILAEQVHAMKYREQVWQRGGRVGTVLSRPVGAPPWSEEAARQFRADWQARFAGDDAPAAGGTPILQDGMELKKVGFSAHEEEFIEGAKLALTTVAAVYHVNPIMVGVLDNANYSNVKAFRQMLYGETLGPLIAAIEARLNSFLLPKIGAADNVYVEFNIAEKLKGSFEEQAAVMQTATGAPWLTRNEARALVNKPAIDGGDELVVPLNVLIGGQASPTDSAPKAAGTVTGGVQRKAVAIGSGSGPSAAHVKQAEQTLRAFFQRQAKSVLSAIPAKADQPGWWDGERWDRELAKDLFGLALAVATEVGQKTAAALGYQEGDYSEERTLAFLRAVAKSRAAMVNATTLGALQDALASDDETVKPEAVFEQAESNRAAVAGATLATTFTGFAIQEAGQQLAPGKATKTWRVTSKSPRSAHARMNGETVGVGEKFSNGAQWPGDPVLGADGVSNCSCVIDLEIP